MSDSAAAVTEDEHDMLKAVWAEADGTADRWVALTELPVVVRRLCRNGYLQLLPAGPDTWSVALTPEGADLARALFDQHVSERFAAVL